MYAGNAMNNYAATKIPEIFLQASSTSTGNRYLGQLGTIAGPVALQKTKVLLVRMYLISNSIL